MQASIRFVITVIMLFLPAGAVRAQPTKTVEHPLTATIETTLTTDAKQIRMFAFDGDPDTYFLSAKDITAGDHFTLVFDKAVAVKSVVVTTGRPKGGDKLDAGNLEASADGKNFELLTKFSDGVAKAKPEGRKILALRIQATKALKHPLAIREIVVDSEPSLAVFKYPVEYIVDVSDAPELKEWANKTARICERAYQWINEDLKSEGFKPPTVVTMTLKNDYKGVAAAGGNHITGSAKYFKDRPADMGAMVHETVHIVQQYRKGGNPGWLVEGIADYIRFFKYEPGKIGKIKADSHYDGSYRTTAAFLNFVAEKYDKNIVRKLNNEMRAGKYREELWKIYTGNSVKALDEEWRASMKKAA